jgi:cell wall assembly regulator SMI1
LKIKLGRIGLESFDQAPTGNVVAPLAQPETPPQPLVPTAGYTEAPFSGQENYAAEENAEHDAAELWKRIKTAFDIDGPTDEIQFLGLNPGVTDSGIRGLETFFHAKLPELLVAILKQHNGQEDWTAKNFVEDVDCILPHICYLFSAERMLEASKGMIQNKSDLEDWYGDIQGNDDRIKKVQWSKEWLVLGSNEDKKPVFYCLDFDPAPGGKHGQVIKVDFDGNERHHLGDTFDGWFRGLVSRLGGHHKSALESHDKPAYPLRKALEADATVIDTDELDQLAMGANSLSSYLGGSSSEMALEAEKNPSDIAKSKMHLRFKKLKDGFVDTFRSAAGMAAKYEKQLDELEEELLKGHTHGQIKVNMSHLWQHFSDEKGPVTHNLLGKVKEDLEFSTYILTSFSQKALEELEALARALHTGQGNSDEQAKRTALDVEKTKGPAEYLDQKWVCAAGEQPYLSVTGLSVTQGRHPRAVGIEGVSLDRLSQLATPYNVREYGSFLHGIKKLFTSSSKAEMHLTAEDLSKLIVSGREYIAAAKHYLEIYNKVWPIFRKIDDSLDLIWEDFDLVEYEVETEDEEGNKETTTWTESNSGPIRRRAAVFDQLMAVVRNYADAVMQPGVNELARALRAAKFHGYLVAAGIKAAEGHGQNAGNVATESTKEDGSDRASKQTFQDVFGDIFQGKLKEHGKQVAQELFGLGKKKDEAPKKHVDVPDVDVQNPPSIAESIKVLDGVLHIATEPALNRPADAEQLGWLNEAGKAAGVRIHPSLVELYKAADGQGDNAGFGVFQDNKADRYFEPLNKGTLGRWVNDVKQAKEEGKKLDFAPFCHFGSTGWIGVDGSGKVKVCSDGYVIEELAANLRQYVANCVHGCSKWIAKQVNGKAAQESLSLGGLLKGKIQHKSNASIADAIGELVKFCAEKKMEEEFTMQPARTGLLKGLQAHIGMELPAQFLELYRDLGDPSNPPPFLPSRMFLRSMKRIAILVDRWKNYPGYQQQWIPLSDVSGHKVEQGYVLDAKSGKVLFLNFSTKKNREEAKDFRTFIADSVEEYITEYKPKYPGGW